MSRGSSTISLKRRSDRPRVRGGVAALLALLVLAGGATAGRGERKPPDVPKDSASTADDCNRRYREGRQRASKQRFDETIALLDVAECYNRNPEWLSMLGVAHNRLNHPTEALRFFQRYLCVDLEAQEERRRTVQRMIQETQEVLLQADLSEVEGLVKAGREQEALERLTHLGKGQSWPEPECNDAKVAPPTVKDGRDVALQMRAQLGLARAQRPKAWAKGPAGRKEAEAVLTTVAPVLALGKALRGRATLTPAVRLDTQHCQEEAQRLRREAEGVAKPLLQRWWLWTAVGAVAAGAVAGAVVAICPWCKKYPNSSPLDFALTGSPR